MAKHLSYVLISDYNIYPKHIGLFTRHFLVYHWNIIFKAIRSITLTFTNLYYKL